MGYRGRFGVAVLAGALMALGLNCGAPNETCATDGPISPHCAGQLVAGFEPVDVSGYEIRALYSSAVGAKEVVSIQYAPTEGAGSIVLMTIQEHTSTTLDVGYERSEIVGRLEVALTERGGSFAAATIGNGVLYQIEVPKATAFSTGELNGIRTHFVEALASNLATDQSGRTSP